jgi:hypothetical protein
MPDYFKIGIELQLNNPTTGMNSCRLKLEEYFA